MYSGDKLLFVIIINNESMKKDMENKIGIFLYKKVKQAILYIIILSIF